MSDMADVIIKLQDLRLKERDALAKAPRPFTAIDDPDKLSAFIIEYADWFFKVRHPALSAPEKHPEAK